jgi:hypothetical protein
MSRANDPPDTPPITRSLNNFQLVPIEAIGKSLLRSSITADCIRAFCPDLICGMTVFCERASIAFRVYGRLDDPRSSLHRYIKVGVTELGMEQRA